VAADDQLGTRAQEPHAGCRRLKALKHEVARGERSVSDQVDLAARRKPTNAKARSAEIGGKEGGLRKVHLGGDRLHGR
jgi:hypothetical protein